MCKIYHIVWEYEWIVVRIAGHSKLKGVEKDKIRVGTGTKQNKLNAF